MKHLQSDELLAKFATIPNYAVLGGMLACSGLIGIYFWRKDQSSPEDTLLGGRSMGIYPITASLIASFLSALTMLGMPAEIYTQGTQLLAVLFFIPIISFVTGEVYMPLFHNLQLDSSYQYLEMRFNRTVKLVSGGFYTFSLMLYMAIVVYAPALALEQVTGINVDTSCLAIFMVCVFYTSVGGIKAVVWTDAFQLFFMFLSAFCILIVATSKAGGFFAVFERNYEDNRIQMFNFDLDIRERHTFWGTCFGFGFMWLNVFGVSQTQIQRYLSLPTIKDAQKAVRLNFFFMIILILMMGWLGMVLYTIYAECDPITAKQVKTKDQVLPLLVLHVAGDIPGLPGLFMAGVFSGSLSSVSTGLNSLAAIALRDFVPPKRLEQLSTIQQAFLTKVFSFLFGLIGYALTFVIRYLPGMLEAAMVIGGVLKGPIFGVFSIGMLVPWVNSRGILVGFFTSLFTMAWIATGGTVNKHFVPYHSRTSPPYPTNLTDCPADWMSDFQPTVSPIRTPMPGHFPLYDISYCWYMVIGASITIILALITTLFTSQDLKTLDRKLLSPVLPKMWSCMPNCLSDRMNKWWDSIGEDVMKDELEMQTFLAKKIEP